MGNDLGWFSVQPMLRVSFHQKRHGEKTGTLLAWRLTVGPSSVPPPHTYACIISQHLSYTHAPHRCNCLLPTCCLPVCCLLPVSCLQSCVRSRGTLSPRSRISAWREPRDVKICSSAHRLDIRFPWVSRSRYSAFAILPSFSGTRRALRVQPSLPGWCSPPFASHPPLFPIAVPSQSPYPP